MVHVIIVSCRLVYAEGLHEPRDRARHAVARIRVDIIRPEPALYELYRRVPFHDGVLARTEDRDADRPELGIIFFELSGHLIKGLLPGDRFEPALLVELAPFIDPQQRFSEPVRAVNDLRV